MPRLKSGLNKKTAQVLPSSLILQCDLPVSYKIHFLSKLPCTVSIAGLIPVSNTEEAHPVVRVWVPCHPSLHSSGRNARNCIIHLISIYLFSD